MFRIDAAFGLALTSVFLAALRPLAALQRVLRGSAHLARARASPRSFLAARAAPRPARRHERPRIDRRAAFGVLGTLGVLVAVNVPSLGSDPWPFRTPPVSAHGLLGPLVRAADGALGPRCRADARVLAGMLVAALAIAGWRARVMAAGCSSSPCVAVVVLVTAPATLLQVGLRDGSAPWFHINDSTYQIELAGELVRHGHTPYGHDYTELRAGAVLQPGRHVPPPSEHPQVALTHFAYFPGTALTAAAWSVRPLPV